MANAEDLVDAGLDWLRQHYDRFRFFTERDVVWSVQTRLLDLVVSTTSAFCPGGGGVSPST